MSASTFQPYSPARPEDSRSPCPALNALANHDYLPHDGKHISVFNLSRAVQNVYHLSPTLAWALAIAGGVLCGNGLSLDLHDLARHGRIEHNGSLAHADATPGSEYAPSTVNPPLLAELLAGCSSGHGLTLDDLARVRARRDQSLARPLDTFHAMIARGECAMTVNVFGDEKGEITKEYLLQWFGEEQLPEGWKGPLQPVGFSDTIAKSRQVAQRVARLNKSHSD